MTHQVILDAGPALSFFSIRKERILVYSVGGSLSAPESVQTEVVRKANKDRRFQAAEGVWNALVASNRLTILSDDVTAELATAVGRISNVPMAERLTAGKDLGEVMVVAHAAVQAEAGQHVVVLIDDGQGAQLATSEMRRLKRLEAAGRPVGTIRLMNTTTVLKRAAGSVHLADRAAMRRIYQQLQELDDGLVDIRRSGLLSAGTWPKA